MYLALSVVTGFQCDNGFGAAGDGGGERVLIRRVKGCVTNIEIVFKKTISSWILKVVDLEKKKENLVYFL